MVNAGSAAGGGGRAGMRTALFTKLSDCRNVKSLRREGILASHQQNWDATVSKGDPARAGGVVSRRGATSLTYGACNSPRLFAFLLTAKYLRKNHRRQRK
jgi:hypothetical protein